MKTQQGWIETPGGRHFALAEINGYSIDRNTITLLVAGHPYEEHVGDGIDGAKLAEAFIEALQEKLKELQERLEQIPRPAHPIAGAPDVPTHPIAGAPDRPANPIADAPDRPAHPIADAPDRPTHPIVGEGGAQPKRR